MLSSSYLNQQHVKKIKLTETDGTYGSAPDFHNAMVEIGDLGNL